MIGPAGPQAVGEAREPSVHRRPDKNLSLRSYENESSDVILSRSGVERILVGVRAAQAKNLARSEVAGRGPVRFFAIAQNDMVCALR